LPWAVSVGFQGNVQSIEDVSERIVRSLPALEDSLREERDESKRPKGRISDLENHGADAGDSLQQTVLSLAEDVGQQRETTASSPEDFALSHERWDDRE
jgi:hypothetical protein